MNYPKVKTYDYKITGCDALRIAQRDGVTLRCHANPLDSGGAVSVALGLQIMKDDPSLLFIYVQPDGWVFPEGTCHNMLGYCVDTYFTASGMYLGPDDEDVEPRWKENLDRDFNAP